MATVYTNHCPQRKLDWGERHAQRGRGDSCNDTVAAEAIVLDGATPNTFAAFRSDGSLRTGDVYTRSDDDH